MILHIWQMIQTLIAKSDFQKSMFHTLCYYFCVLCTVATMCVALLLWYVVSASLIYFKVLHVQWKLCGALVLILPCFVFIADPQGSFSQDRTFSLIWSLHVAIHLDCSIDLFYQPAVHEFTCAHDQSSSDTQKYSYIALFPGQMNVLGMRLSWLIKWV